MMKMMIDSSCGMIYNLRYEYRKTDLKFLQLRTPLTGYKKDGLGFLQYGLDNGSFTDFNPKKFEQMAHEAKTDNQCLWIALPDVVGDHESTLILYYHWLERLDLDGETKKRCFICKQEGGGFTISCYIGIADGLGRRVRRFGAQHRTPPEKRRKGTI